MIVKWTERISAAHFENVQGMYPNEADPSDFDKEHKGEVVGSNKNFWGTTYLVVACKDGTIREVEMSQAKAVNE